MIREGRSPPRRVPRWGDAGPRSASAFTLALFVLGTWASCGALAVVGLESAYGGAEASPALAVGAAAIGIACLLVALLRTLRAGTAAFATGVLCLGLVLWFPVGTLVALWWLFGIRNREAAPPQALLRADRVEPLRDW